MRTRRCAVRIRRTQPVNRRVRDMGDRPRAIGDYHRIEIDELVAFLLVIGGNSRPHGERFSNPRDRKMLYLAADVNPRPEHDVVHQHSIAES